MKKTRIWMSIALILIVILSLAACGGNKNVAESNGTEVESTKNAKNDNDESEKDNKKPSDSEKAEFTIPGYQLGEIPPIPLVTIPTVQEHQFEKAYSDEQTRVVTVIEEGLSTVNGIRVEPAIFVGGEIAYMPFNADGSGTYSNLSGNTHVNIDKDANGSGSYLDLSGDDHVKIEKNADGSGSQLDLSGDTHVNIDKDADGSGTYSNLSGDTHVNIDKGADGSGSYLDLSGADHVKIERNADGSGSYLDLSNNDHVKIERNADGSGSYLDLSGDNHVKIERNVDGSGTYSNLSGDNNIDIEIKSKTAGSYSNINTGVEYEYIDENNASYRDNNLAITIKDGVAEITENKNNKTIEVDALPLSEVHLIDELPPIQEIPDIGNIGDFKISGFRIIFDSAILFDFDKYELREEGKAAIELLVDKINELGIKNIEIHGHTDSIADDAYNQTLSKKRTESAYDYANEVGLNAQAKSIGYGESKPIAPNNNADGSDNPAGRQLNRRVEFFIPVQ